MITKSESFVIVEFSMLTIVVGGEINDETRLCNCDLCLIDDHTSTWIIPVP